MGYVLKYATTLWLAWQKIYGFAEIAESFLTWNEGKTKIVQYVTMGNISHSETINKFHIKNRGSLTQINAAVFYNIKKGRNGSTRCLTLEMSGNRCLGRFIFTTHTSTICLSLSIVC
ncbi:MAG: hypothetical protein DLM72_17415 [Candidatus Nitrosopolaris wilkensis]|nr:MAG: hypothetical protein DLM72_17415 [Candidatus Nitrosopolaris wilkensis]